MCPPIYLSEIVFFVEYLQEKSSKLHFSTEFLILEKLKIVWKALTAREPVRLSRKTLFLCSTEELLYPLIG